MSLLQRGFTLIEIVIGITVVGVMSAITVPSGMNAYRKAEANNLEQEFHLLQSSIPQLRSMKRSHIPMVEVKIENLPTRIVPIANSTAFSEIRKTHIVRPTIESGYETSDIGVMDEKYTSHFIIRYDHEPDGIYLDCTPNFNKTKSPSARYAGITPGEWVTSTVPLGNDILASDGVKFTVPNLSANGSTRIPPIFNLSDKTLLEDFIDSPKGLNLKDFRVHFKDNMQDEDLLCILFGGKNRQSGSIESMEFSSLPEFNYPIELTKADISNLKYLESNSSLKISTNLADGQLFYVTNFISKPKFIQYMKTEITDSGESSADDDKKFKYDGTGYMESGRYCDTLFDSSVSEGELTRLLGEMYDILAEGFKVDTPVYIPHKFSGSTKCVESDMKHGYYRP